MIEKLSELLRDAWSYFSRNFAPLCAIILPFVIPIEFVSAILEHYEKEDDAISWLVFVGSMLVFPIYQGALILYIASTVVGESFPIKQYYSGALKYWPALMILYIATAMTMMAGFILLVIPGLIFMARFAFCEFHCILQNEKAMEAYSSSWEQTKEHQWLILFGMLFIYVIAIFPVLAIELIAESVNAYGAVLTFMTGVVSSVLIIPATIFGFRVYTMHQEMLNKANQ